jgi:hypothetical protein
MKLLRILVFSCSTKFNRMKRVCSMVKFAFHVHELVLILCIIYKLSMKRLFVTAGSDNISTASLKTSLYFQKYKRMGWTGIAQSV